MMFQGLDLYLTLNSTLYLAIAKAISSGFCRLPRPASAFRFLATAMIVFLAFPSRSTCRSKP